MIVLLKAKLLRSVPEEHLKTDKSIKKMYFKDFLNNQSKTLIMGILNLTPDSFYDGNKYIKNNNLVNRFKILEKVDIIDVGCETSKPGSLKIRALDELKRLKLIDKIPFLDNKFYSIDTYKPNIAKYALDNGFNMINDISGGEDLSLLNLAADYDVPIILMHMQNKPHNMQNKPKYSNIIDELSLFFDKRINRAVKAGINEKHIIIDPGIGFGKTIKHNDEIIRNLSKIKAFELPILIGLSRKSFLSFNQNEPLDRLASSIAFGSIAINNGADIIRTHDINQSIEVFSLIDRLLTKK